MKKKNGFSLVELIIVLAILAFMIVMAIGIINSAGITDKARDARRKKDLRDIKIAFEEYFNDKGQFINPELLAKMTDKENCGKKIEDFPNLKSWPCDPRGKPYFVFVEPGNRFRVITNLENKKDKDIPDGWYSKGDSYRLLGLTINDVNYGVSSSNILWYEDGSVDYSMCDKGVCMAFIDGNCKHISGSCIGPNCFYWPKSGSGPTCSSCQTGCCGDGCP